MEAHGASRGKTATIKKALGEGDRQERMLLLHGLIKKTRKTPQRDIDLALKRKRGT